MRDPIRSNLLHFPCRSRAAAVAHAAADAVAIAALPPVAAAVTAAADAAAFAAVAAQIECADGIRFVLEMPRFYFEGFCFAWFLDIGDASTNRVL